jgi:hypothetical protein
MINEMNMTADEIRRAGIEALSKALGPVGMARFMQQFEKGSGDYTKERKELLKNITLDQAIKEIKEMRKTENTKE